MRGSRWFVAGVIVSIVAWALALVWPLSESGVAGHAGISGTVRHFSSAGPYCAASGLPAGLLSRCWAMETEPEWTGWESGFCLGEAAEWVVVRSATFVWSSKRNSAWPEAKRQGRGLSDCSGGDDSLSFLVDPGGTDLSLVAAGLTAIDMCLASERSLDPGCKPLGVVFEREVADLVASPVRPTLHLVTDGVDGCVNFLMVIGNERVSTFVMVCPGRGSLGNVTLHVGPSHNLMGRA
jgi:hypothetical protein